MDDNHSYRTIVCGHCGHTISIPLPCGNRFCPICSRTRNRRIRFKLTEFAKQVQPKSGESMKLLTLSIANDANLFTQVNNLLKSFRRLRQRAFWKKHVSGGAFVVEVKKGEKGWHAHLHILLQSKYIPWERLKVHWEAVSGGIGVHIERIPIHAIVKYVTKYVTKSEMPESDQREASRVLRNVRLFQPFGSWTGILNGIKTPKAFCPVCERAVWVFNPFSTFSDYMDKKMTKLGHLNKSPAAYFETPGTVQSPQLEIPGLVV